jgi:2-phosphoglycerate kinase
MRRKPVTEDWSVDWTVTVICGASGVGKSSIARPLAIRQGVPLAEADDVVTALKALTMPATHPALHRWDTDPAASSWSPQRIVEHTMAVAAELAPGFRAVIADHIEYAAPVVLEGDYLTPDLVAGLDGARAVVISEPDGDRIVANLLAREPHAGEQRFRALVSVGYEACLVASAQLAGVPVVRARPFHDALTRVELALRGREAAD